MIFIDHVEKKGINQIVKLKVDEMIQDGKSNFKIKQSLEQQGFVEEVIPDNKQISNRRFYLRSLILGDLANNTKGGFFTWINEHKKDFNTASPHELIIISYELKETDFRLLLTTKSLLENATKENANATGYLAMDSTHKLVSCQFKFTTITTATVNQEMADIAYLIHAHENSETFTYALSEIKRSIKENYDFDWEVKVCIFYELLIIYLVHYE